MKKNAKKTSPKKKTMAPDILKDIWPTEREYMERPHRWKYVRKIAQPETCVFCDAHAASKKKPSFESLVLYKTKHSMLVLNKFPYNTGHVMVLPLEHCGEIDELPLAVHLDMQKLLKDAIKILKKVYGCAGFNAGINLGAVAGAGIPSHLHWHIVPRWFGDTNFFPLIAETKALPETLEQTYKKLAPYFRNYQESRR